MTGDIAPLKSNWFHILLCLAGGEQHGYAIMQEVLERTEGKVRLWPATLYGALRRMMEDGLIEEGAEQASQESSGGDRRRCYRLTGAGRRSLEAEIQRLEDLVRAARAKRRELNARTAE
jgi:DNA-binding PadR family transcriptional regulator